MLLEYNVWHLSYENGAQCMMLVNYTGSKGLLNTKRDIPMCNRDQCTFYVTL